MNNLLKFHVRSHFGGEGFIITDECQYLHYNGTINPTILNKDEAYSGLYFTQKAAEKILAKYKPLTFTDLQHGENFTFDGQALDVCTCVRMGNYVGYLWLLNNTMVKQNDQTIKVQKCST